MDGNELEVRERADTTGMRRFARSVVTESAVYGVILVSAMVIVTGQKSDASIDVFLKALGTVIVFWIAHIFAEVVGGFGATGGDDAVSVRKLIAHGVRRSGWTSCCSECSAIWPSRAGRGGRGRGLWAPC